MRNGTKFTPGSSLPMEKEETERGGVRIPRKKREKKENLDVRGAGIFVECVSRITGSYQYALTPRYTMKKLERIRIGYTVTLSTRRESYRWQIWNKKKKEERILVKKVSSVSSSFYSDYKFEISVDEIRYVYFEIKEKREKQKNIEIFSFMQITINLKFYLVCKNLVF